MSMSEELKKKILAIPGEDGFWKKDSEDEFIRNGKRLKARGFEDSEIIAILESLYWAVANCYGD